MKMPPNSPFSTRLSGSAKETELRIRSLFQWKKQRPPVWLMAAMATLILSCGGLVSCRVQPGDNGSAQTEPVPTSIPSPDLNQNGIPEEIRLVEAYGALEIQFFEHDQLLKRESPGVCLCTLDGTDYILRQHLDEYKGDFRYYWQLSDLSGEFEETFQWGSVEFDTNFGALFHKEFDPAAIAAFTEELNGLLAQSVQLSEQDGVLTAAPAPAVTLDWMAEAPAVFTPDPGKPLEENLRGFQQAMAGAYPPAVPMGTAETLPIREPLTMTFSSGAGAWATELTLHPDGSFTGDYHDADGATQYVCQFHGRFRDFSQLTDASWLLTLDTLTLDTGHPVGSEWDDGGRHLISSNPNGFDDAEGDALRPGAQFVLYTPEARGHAPGTELYGAYEFWSWWPYRHAFHSDMDTLGCYGLYNLTARIGFFS